MLSSLSARKLKVYKWQQFQKRTKKHMVVCIEKNTKDRAADNRAEGEKLANGSSLYQRLPEARTRMRTLNVDLEMKFNTKTIRPAHDDAYVPNTKILMFDQKAAAKQTKQTEQRLATRSVHGSLCQVGISVICSLKVFLTQNSDHKVTRPSDIRRSEANGFGRRSGNKKIIRNKDGVVFFVSFLIEFTKW